MTAKNNTKRTLLASVLSLLLCLAMLVSTTFAWFTDSVTSGSNKIVAGNLKVDFIHVGGGENGEDISLKTNPDHKIFDYDKWEPNYTVMETLKIVNDGSLAFKFRLDATAAGATAGPNGEKLADVIDIYVYEGTGDPADTASFADMTEENGWRLAGSLSTLMTDPDGMAYGVLLPEGAEPKNGEPVGSVQMTIALHMQMSAGNEYQGLSLGDLSFNLSAAQYSFEKDSFGPDYDRNVWNGEVDTAWFTDAEEEQTTYTLNSPAELAGLSNLVKNGTDFSGKTITLNQNIDLNNRTWTPIGSKEDKIYFSGTFDGNGNTISGLNLPDGDYVALFEAIKDAVVKNLTVSGTVDGENGAGIVARMESGLIENCVSMVHVNSTGKAGGIVCLTNTGGCEITNCANYGTVNGGAPEIITCSGGSAPITSPAITLGFTGQSFQLQLNENDCAGRLIGANQGGGPSSWTKLTIDDNNGDDYQDIGAIGICGNTTTWSNLEVISGTLHGDPVAGNGTYIKINENVNWNQREPGTYTCGGVVESTRKTEWTKQG